MIWDTVVLVVMIMMVISFTVVTLLWVRTLKRKTETPSPPGFLKADLGMRCISDDQKQESVLSEVPTDFIPQKCKEGLFCYKYDKAKDYGTCLKSVGTKCSNLSECVPDASYCVGVCSTRLSGGVGQPCTLANDPCKNAGTVCDLASNNSTERVCKSKTGGSCSSDSQCYDGYCDGPSGSKICKKRLENGRLCKSNRSCESGACLSEGAGKNAFCQNSMNVPVGGIGYACSTNIVRDDVPKCKKDSLLQDSSGDIVNRTLACAYSNINDNYGTCQPAITRWPNDGCNSEIACLPPSICVNGNCIFPEDPNNCGTGSTGSCIKGYKCSTSLNQCEPEDDGIPINDDNKVGFARWSVDVDSSEDIIGRWVSEGVIPSSENFLLKSNKELFTLDYKGGTIYVIGGKETYNLKINDTSQDVKTSVFNLYRSTSSGLTKLTLNLQYTFKYSGSIINPKYGKVTYYDDNEEVEKTIRSRHASIDENLSLQLVSLRMTLEGELFFFIKFSFIESQSYGAGEVPKTYYRPYIIDMPEDFFDEAKDEATINIIHECFEYDTPPGPPPQKTRYKLYYPYNKDIMFQKVSNGTDYDNLQGKIDDIYAETRIVTTVKSVLLSIKMLPRVNYSNIMFYTIKGINDLISTGPRPDTQRIDIYNECAKRLDADVIVEFPYIYAKSIDFHSNVKAETIYYIENTIQIKNTSILLQVPSEDNKPLYLTYKLNILPIYSKSYFYNVGSTYQQFIAAYINRFQGNGVEGYELIYVSSGLYHTLPGFFNKNSIISIATRYNGDNKDLVISESQWKPRLNVLTYVS